MIIENHKKAALVFLVIGLINALLAIYELYPPGILWFCSTTVWLFALGLYFRNDLLISSTVTASFVIEFLWTIDYLSFFLTGNLTIGIAEYLLTTNAFRIIITAYHLVMLVVPIMTIFELKKFHKHSWAGASVYFLVISTLTLILTKPNANLNCVFKTCSLGVLSFLEKINELLLGLMPPIIIHWLFLTVIVFIPTHFAFRAIVKWVSNEPKRN